MQRPLSQLIYTPFQDSQGGPTVMTLHRYSAFAEGMRDIGLAVNPTGRVLGLQSTKGVYIGRNIVGYTWFIGPLQQPSPVHFGDSLAEIEQFLWDDIDRQQTDRPMLPFLIGVEQGAIMALAAAAAVPDLLSGVIAVEGSFPIVPGWSPPLAPLNDLPILLVEPPSSEVPSERVLTGQSLVETFQRWGANVTLCESEAGAIPAAEMSTWLASQSIRHRLTER